MPSRPEAWTVTRRTVIAFEDAAAVPRDACAVAQQRADGGCAQAGDEFRSYGIDLGLQPRQARADLAGARRLMDATPAAGLPLEVLDGVGDVDAVARQRVRPAGPLCRRAVRRRASDEPDRVPPRRQSGLPSCRGRSRGSLVRPHAGLRYPSSRAETPPRLALALAYIEPEMATVYCAQIEYVFSLKHVTTAAPASRVRACLP
jgi:hypothetical protein